MKYRTDGENDERTSDPGKTGQDTSVPAAATPRRPAKAMLDESGRIRVPEDVLCAWSADPGDELRALTRRAGLALARRIFRRFDASGNTGRRLSSRSHSAIHMSTPRQTPNSV